MKDDREFTALAEEYMDVIYRIAMHTVRCPADAEDVTQNVLLRLYRYGPDFESPAHVKHWIIRVTINEAKRMVTMPWRSREASWDAAAAEMLEGTAAEGDFRKGEILREVLQLPVKYRLPIYLYYYEGYSVREIGALLSRGESTVQTQLARGHVADCGAAVWEYGGGNGIATFSRIFELFSKRKFFAVFGKNAEKNG